MKFALIAALAATLAAPSAYADSHNPAVKDSHAKTKAEAAKGHNSFTEGQARGRIAKAGYSNVGKLAKNKNGVWQGKAMKDGKSVTVALDYKGNVILP